MAVTKTLEQMQASYEMSKASGASEEEINIAMAKVNPEFKVVNGTVVRIDTNGAVELGRRDTSGVYGGDPKYAPYQGDPTGTNFNPITGSEESTWMQKAIGGVDNGHSYSGFVRPVYNAASSIYKNYIAYQNMQETEKMNKQNFAIAGENMERQRIDQANKYAQVEINRGIGMGNANSMAGTAALVSGNPRSKYNRFNYA